VEKKTDCHRKAAKVGRTRVEERSCEPWLSCKHLRKVLVQSEGKEKVAKETAEMLKDRKRIVTQGILHVLVVKQNAEEVRTLQKQPTASRRGRRRDETLETGSQTGR